MIIILFLFCLFRNKLLSCLSECFYYAEIATLYTRLLHDIRDYIATLKHYKIPLPLEVNSSGVLTLDEISKLAEKPLTNVTTTGTHAGAAKLKKLLEGLEARRKALEAGVSSTASQQQLLNVMSMAALAGAATMMRCLPEPPQPINPIVKPLMEAIKREDDQDLQKLAAQHLSYLVSFCVDRDPSPNKKVYSIIFQN